MAVAIQILEFYQESPLQNHVVLKLQYVLNQEHDCYPICNPSFVLLLLLK